jgi:chromosome segregation ATPase
MTGIQVDTRTVNINTLISIAGFLGTIVMIGVAWGTTQSTIRDLEQWRQGHETAHRDLQATIATRSAVIDQQLNALRGELAKIDRLEYRVTSNEKGLETLDGRINRITESYGNQFADMRSQLSSISTQIALTNQTLQRMEAATPGKP